MLRNYLKIAFRSLWRSKVHSVINVAGLSLGIACCMLIVLFVKDELTFDAFHKKADRIYRGYVKENYGENQVFFNTVTPFPLGPTLKDNLPEIEQQVRINPYGTQVKVGENQFSESVTIVGEHFFDVFDFRIIKGERTNVLSGINNVILTDQIAKKYFGNDDPINQVITIQISEKAEEFMVKAVVENPPVNSSIQFKILISDLNFTRMFSEQVLTSSWFNVNPETYVLLKPGAKVADVVEKFPPIFKTALGEDDYKQSNYTVGLQPLTGIHLDTSFPAGIAPVSNPRYSYILSAVALLILFVACINFVTLSVGRSLKRAREVGIRKVAGALRGQLVVQFIGEAVLITLLSLAVGFMLALVSLPVFNTLAAKQLSLGPDVFTFLVATVLVVIIGLIAGSYPAFVLSNFRPVMIFRGTVQGISSRQGLRTILVGIQLVLTVFLISSTLIMRNQLNYLQNKNLGFNREQLAVIQLNVPREGRLTERVQRGFEMVQLFKGELSKIPNVAGVCGTSHDFANGNWTAVGYTDQDGVYRTFNLNTVEPEYFTVLQMQFAAGRNFNNNSTADVRRGVIVNEAFVKELKWDEALGKKIPGRNFGDHEVIGVVKDFNYASLYTRIEPLVLVMDPSIILQGVENISIGNSPIPKLVIRLKPGDMAQTINQVKEVWNKLTGSQEFTFAFVDQAIAAQYASDQNLGRIIRIATGLAILIGSLGLYGLASLAMQSRTKEIGIRKVLGATERSLLLLLSRDYVLLVVASLVISIPITWLVMRDWLAGFEYRVAIGVDVFLLSGCIALGIALLTISYQAFRTAWTQPAETLKYE
ncbi:MAG: ABC transporter permease [Flammeovirgaceae bacterium]|nr:MAG: ABC transporter permease [Flammeovirgaceae bacterium]